MEMMENVYTQDKEIHGVNSCKKVFNLTSRTFRKRNLPAIWGGGGVQFHHRQVSLCN
jgi:hypothetical protein